MDAVFIAQQAPWVFRSGRPFGQGGEAAALEFPWPTTCAGMVRTLLGDRLGVDFADAEAQRRLREIPVHGPLVARRAGEGVEPLLPAPADALLLRDSDSRPRLHVLRPEPVPEGCGTDLPDGLWPVTAPEGARGKPLAGPRWWELGPVTDWLCGRPPAGAPDELGWEGPGKEARTHVAVAADTGAAEEGRLFQTTGLDFRGVAGRAGGVLREYGLLLACPEPVGGLLRVGGESRLGHAETIEGAWPRRPDDLGRALAHARTIRLVLVTPAVFGAGWRPGWLGADLVGSPPDLPGLRLRLRAAAVPRWEAHSGWDLASWRPRAIRRLVPAGAVYWMDVLEGAQQVAALWLRSVADREQDRRDGFGLVVPGLWTPKDGEESEC